MFSSPPPFFFLKKKEKKGVNGNALTEENYRALKKSCGVPGPADFFIRSSVYQNPIIISISPFVPFSQASSSPPPPPGLNKNLLLPIEVTFKYRFLTLLS